MKRRSLILAAGLALILLVTYLPIYNPDDAAAVMQRHGDGNWVREESTHLSIGFRALTGTSMHTGFRAVTDTQRVKRVSPTHISRIWIVNQSEGFFSREFGRAIQEALLEDPLLDEVGYFPASDLPLKIYRPPHLFITYRIESFHEHHWPVWFDWETSIRIQIGGSPLAMPTQGETDRPAPVAAMVLEYAESGLGLVTQAVRFDQGLAQLVSMLDCKAKLTDWRGVDAEETPLAWAGDLPAPPTDLPWLDAQGATLLIQQAPAPLLQEHVWALPATFHDPDVLLAWENSLQANGWSQEPRPQRKESSSFQEFVADKGTRRLRLYSLDWENPELGPFAVQHMRHGTPEQLTQWIREKDASDEAPLALRRLIETMPSTTKQSLASYLDRQGIVDFPADLRKWIE